MRSPLVVLVVAAVVSACAATMAPSSGAMSTSSPVASAIQRVRLPDGFPVLPGASPLPLADDDPGLIAAWGSDELGPAAYEFYLRTLPSAGYPIVGAYPGDSVAVIRFDTAGSGIWQMMVQTGSGAARIEIRLDRP